MSPIVLPEAAASLAESLTPREIVAELDKYVVGQAKAKRAVAIALRNRYRRQRLAADMADEVAPKNILMIGPTGVGKTEIARRLARLAQSPFLKIEASKFTEVGYVGRDVESMVRDLVEIAVKMVREEREAEVREKARQAAEERVLDLLLPPAVPPSPTAFGDQSREADMARDHASTTRERLREQLRAGRLDTKTVEIEVHAAADAVVRDHRRLVRRGDRRQPARHAARVVPRQVAAPPRARAGGARAAHAGRGAEAHRHGGGRARPRSRASSRPASSSSTRSTRSPAARASHGPDVSREGVQRDILPIVEGTTVNTKYGMVRTDHVLFIAAGAFHVSKPSDLIPELQGRFPIRVELEALGRDDFVRILTEPKNALMKQYMALMATEGVTLEFTPDADRAHRRAGDARQRAHREHRRAAPAHRDGAAARRRVVPRAGARRPRDRIDAPYVDRMLADIAKSDDLSRYIL